MPFDPGARLLFIGDSITDAGRAQPVGEGPGGLGQGFVRLVDAMVQVRRPEARVRTINVGTSGHTVRDLAERWERDVLGLRPDVLSVMIGINDIWRHFDHPCRPELHVPLDEYARTLEDLVARTRPTVRRLVLMTPFFMEPNRDDPMRRMTDAYADVVRRLADGHGATLVDAQAAIDRLLVHRHPMALAWDRVHPNHIVDFALADAWCAAVGV